MKPITETQFDPAFLTDPKYWWNRKTAEELALPAEPCFQELLAITQNNKKLFSLISTTIPTMPGWCSVEKACSLAALVLAMKPKTVIEIGVFGGRSLLPMAWAIRENEFGGVIGIDPYQAQASAADQFPADQKWWSELDHEAIMKTFQTFVRNFKLDDVVTLARVSSDEFKPVPCRLVHIDGNHCDAATRDAERFGPKVELGGIVILDDRRWSGGSILRAEDFLESSGFANRFISADQDWSIFQRTQP